LIKGITDTKIRTEMMIEQIGSAMYHPKYLMSSEDMMTPKEPSASAKI